MSWHCSAWAKAQRTGSPARKALLLVLADYANAEGVAYPSIETLAEESEQSKSSVIRGLDELVTRGLIIKQRRREDGFQATNEYRLNADLPAQKKALRGNKLVQTPECQNDTLSEEGDQGVNQSVKTALPECQNSPSRVSLVTPKQEELENRGTTRARARDPQDDLFNRWWEAYPQHGHGFSRDRARVAWVALSPEDRALALEQVKHITGKHMKRGKPQEPWYWLQDRVFATMAEERKAPASTSARGWERGYFARPHTPQWEAWAKHLGKPPYDFRDVGGNTHIGLRSAYDPRQGSAGRWFETEWPPTAARAAPPEQHPLL